jgi:hypothetical protein
MAHATPYRFGPKARHANDSTAARAVDQAIEELVVTDWRNRWSLSTCSTYQQQLCRGRHGGSTEPNFAHLSTS